MVLKLLGLSRAGVSQTSSGEETQEMSKSHSYYRSGCGRLPVRHEAVGVLCSGRVVAWISLLDTVSNGDPEE